MTDVREVLRVDAIDAGYGQSQVLFGMQLLIREGETATLLGRKRRGARPRRCARSSGSRRQ